MSLGLVEKYYRYKINSHKKTKKIPKIQKRPIVGANDDLKAPEKLYESRQKSVGKRYFEFLSKPTFANFFALNYTLAWFIC